MTNVRITGGKPLQGRLKISSNKNAVLPVLCATMLTVQPCVLKNVPRSPDVLKILQAINELGGTHTWDGDMLTVCCENITSKPVSDCVADIQSAILFVGPLLARFGTANVPVAIGCKLGYRGPEDHIKYLAKLGVSCRVEAGRVIFYVDLKELSGSILPENNLETLTRHFLFSEASVTPTENILMLLSIVTKFDVELQGIAAEPHAQFLAEELKKMGVSIDGRGSALLIRGRSVEHLRGIECDFDQEPDYVDFYGSAVMVALTKGDVILECLPTLSIRHMVEFLVNSGVVCEILPDGVRINGAASVYEPMDGFSKADHVTWKLSPRPWPGFPVDCLPSFIAWACANQHAASSTTAINWMYEDGLGYVERLVQLGADIISYPTDLGLQKVLIRGSESGGFLHKDDEKEMLLDGVPVIEGMRAILSAALARKGTTVINGIDPILRRSPLFIHTCRELGAQIEEVGK